MLPKSFLCLTAELKCKTGGKSNDEFSSSIDSISFMVSMSFLRLRARAFGESAMTYFVRLLIICDFEFLGFVLLPLFFG